MGSDGRFHELATEAIPAGVAFADFDNDGDQDCFVSSFNAPNRLYRREHNGFYTDVTDAAGLSHTAKSYSAAWGGINRDGLLDLFVCVYGTLAAPQPSLLYLNQGDGTFREIASTAGVDQPTMPALAAIWFDYDNDGDQDLYVVGFHMANMNRANRLFDNNGNGTFTKIGAAAGVDNTGTDYGLTVGDPNDDGVGALVRVTAGGHTQIQDVRRGSSYLPMNNAELMFGLGQNSTIDSITVSWPSGLVDRWITPPVDVALIAHEGGSLEIPARFHELATEAIPAGVAFSWVLRPNPYIVGTVVFRRHAGGGPETRISGPNILSPATTSFIDTSVQPHRTYRYQVIAIFADGHQRRSQTVSVTTPAAHAMLYQSAPNPANPQTLIRFESPYEQRLILKIHDIQGALVKTLIDEIVPAGSGSATWDGRDQTGQHMASGVYFCRLQAGGDLLTKSLVLLK